jgi:LuxR family maltose regulon positive regulatory protein
MRASGTLADLHVEALTFSPDEALEMLSRVCPDPGEIDLAAIAAWTQGWAAALQLAVLAIRSQRTGELTGSRPDGAVTGSRRLVDDYVWHEVLHAERPEVIELLLATSVVDRVSYGLAEALSGRTDAGDVLDEAESRGLFVTSLDAGGWFEVHALVREMLRAELARRRPHDLLEQHARAARWFEGVGDERAAIEHWLRAGRPAEALRVLAVVAVRADGRRGPGLVGALHRIPPGVAGDDPEAQVRYAWCQLLTDRPSLDDAVAAAAVACRPGDPQVALLQSVAELAGGDWPQAARRARATLGETTGRDPFTSLGWAVVAEGLALDERWDDRSGEVAEARVGLAHDTARRTAFEGTRAVALALAGEPLVAFRVAAGARRAADAVEAPGLRTEVALAEALASLELGDDERARVGLEALAAAPSYPLSHVQVLARLELVGTHLDAGDLPAAVVAFEAAEELCRRELDGVGGVGWLARAGVRLSLAQDDADAAGHWVERIDDPFWGPCSAARVDLASGRSAEALERLGSAVARSPRQRVVAGLLTAQALAGDDHDAALKEVASAVELAAEHGMLRTVAVEGRAVVELVELAAWRVPHAWMDRVRRALVPAADGGAPAVALVEPLTDRERDVLRLLPSRLTLREIASELFVSQNTLKFHLRVIYRKLGVNGRAEAVETARRLRLLGRG